MTNWMTAAGLALIAGGLATLISFRAVLFRGGARRARRPRRAIEAPRRRPALPAAVDPVETSEPAEVVAPRRSRRGRRRALVAASEERPDDEPGGLASIGLADEPGGLASIGLADEPGGLASIGLADEPGALASIGLADEPGTLADEPGALADEHGALADEPGGLASIGLADEEFEPEAVPEPEPELMPELAPGEPAELTPEPVAAARADRYADRVEGWVRPEYQVPADEARPGEYWTPIPVDLAGDAEPSAKGYGWPLPVERLPAVPPYEPATGFDLIPVATEPTEVVPAWPGGINDERPGRIRLPRSWSTRNEKPEPQPKRRPRPRPGPPDAPIDHSTVYVSRHAAEPPR